MQPQLEQMLEKLEHLSPDRLAKVEDFVDFQQQRDRDKHLRLVYSSASESAFAKVWDNEEDAIYDQPCFRRCSTGGFPFTSLQAVNKRPAVIISYSFYRQDRPDVILMAITSQVRQPLKMFECETKPQRLQRHSRRQGIVLQLAVFEAIVTEMTTFLREHHANDPGFRVQGSVPFLDG